jgi:hypothetical protein
MNLRFAIPLLFIVCAAAAALRGSDFPTANDPPLTVPSPTPWAYEIVRPDPFDAVFNIMNRPRSQKGCLGCHIGPERTTFTWFGWDRDSVLLTLETGIDPEGEELPRIPVEGGRFGILGTWLHEGIMPLGGTAWEKRDLKLLDRWLIQYE